MFTPLSYDIEYNLNNNKKISILINGSYEKTDTDNYTTNKYGLLSGIKYYVLKQNKGLYLGTNIGYFHEESWRISSYYSGAVNGYTSINTDYYVIHSNIGYKFTYRRFSILPEIGYHMKIIKNYKSVQETYHLNIIDIKGIEDINRVDISKNLLISLSLGYSFNMRKE